MARRCDLLNTGPMSGNNVSHAMNKTRRRFEVNLCNVTLASDALGQKFKMRIAAKTLRTVDFKGGYHNPAARTGVRDARDVRLGSDHAILVLI